MSNCSAAILQRQTNKNSDEYASHRQYGLAHSSRVLVFMPFLISCFYDFSPKLDSSDISLGVLRLSLLIVIINQPLSRRSFPFFSFFALLNGVRERNWTGTSCSMSI